MPYFEAELSWEQPQRAKLRRRMVFSKQPTGSRLGAAQVLQLQGINAFLAFGPKIIQSKGWFGHIQSIRKHPMTCLSLAVLCLKLFVSGPYSEYPMNWCVNLLGGISGVGKYPVFRKFSGDRKVSNFTGDFGYVPASIPWFRISFPSISIQLGPLKNCRCFHLWDTHSPSCSRPGDTWRRPVALPRRQNAFI